MFNKAEYWKRRKAGLRGQVVLTSPPKIALWTQEDHEAKKCGEKQIGKPRTSGVTMVMSKGGLAARSRAQSRRKYSLPEFTKANHARKLERKAARAK